MNRDKNAEAAILGQPTDEKFHIEFYLHETVDSEATFDAAMAIETARAEELTIQRQKPWVDRIRAAEARGAGFVEIEQLTKKKLDAEVEPDYRPENLKKLGATTVYKEVPYIKIQRHGSRIVKSYQATEQHQEQHPDEWAQFEADNHEYFENKRKRENQVLQDGEPGPQNPPQGRDYQGGVCFTPSQYTTTFG